MSDLADKLRSPANVFYEYAADDGALLREAADSIDRLEHTTAQYFKGVQTQAQRAREAEARLAELQAPDLILAGIARIEAKLMDDDRLRWNFEETITETIEMCAKVADVSSEHYSYGSTGKCLAASEAANEIAAAIRALATKGGV